jgi:hypothetical protein
VLEAQSGLLRNPADTHTLKVFDPQIRGHTDQVFLRFRKPFGQRATGRKDPVNSNSARRPMGMHQRRFLTAESLAHKIDMLPQHIDLFSMRARHPARDD